MYRAIAAQPDLFAAYYLPMSESTLRSERLRQVPAGLLRRLRCFFH